MTAQTVITAAFRKLGLGRAPDATDLADFLESLQSMLRYWASKKMYVYASIQETFSTVVGASYRTWGSGGNITTARPSQIVNMFIRDYLSIDSPIYRMYETEYLALSSKLTSGRPTSFFYSPLYPLAYLYLYPVPDAIETVYVNSIKPWTETSSFDVVGSTLSFPVEYEAAIIHNLAVWMAPEYNVIPSAVVKSIADSTLYTIMSRNAAAQITPVILNFFQGGSYDINQG